MHLARESVTGLATDARSSRVTLHRNRKRKGFDAPILESRCHLLDHGFVLERGIGIAGDIGWFGWINASLAMDSVDLFR
jgi:hypothetical protein